MNNNILEDKIKSIELNNIISKIKFNYNINNNNNFIKFSNECINNDYLDENFKYYEYLNEINLLPKGLIN